ncbi:hypothetical protein YC2023_081364 [Brassica napus]
MLCSKNWFKHSTWGQFFRNAELEKTLDQDLSRLYPEHWCYFQAPGCQGMVRRILLLWCLKHPEYGYRQGMHELFAPLLYVLHVDIMRLSQVRKDYEDYFTDRFDSLSFEEKDISYTFDFNKFVDSMDDDEISHLVELGVETQYFGLRWLRVLFGREFSLQGLLLVWDEIFLADNSTKTFTYDDEHNGNNMFKVFDSPRGALLSGMAVSMILYLRSSLLSSENATCCLQRLLNFPEEIDLDKIIQKKWLQGFVWMLIYWEEKWRLLRKAEEEERQRSPFTQKKKRWLKVTKLIRAVTDLSRFRRRTVLEGISQKIISNEEATECPVTVSKEKSPTQETEEGSMGFHTVDEESVTSGEESSSVYSDPTSLVRDSNYLENDSDSSTASNSSPGENHNSEDSLRAENSHVSLEPTSPE